MGPISTTLLLARLYARIHIQNNAGWDDWLMLAAFCPTIALTVIFPLVTEVYRFNRHIWDVEFHYFPIQRRYVMAIYCLFTLASGLLKMSILLFYRRISSRTVSRTFLWILRITWAMVLCYTIAFTIIPIFSCTPITAFWDQVDVNKILAGYKYKCINEGADVVANGIASTLQDLIVAILPTILCWNLKMPIRQKVALYSIFAISYTTIAIGAVRTYTGYRILFVTYDVTWVASDTWLWSLLELHIGAMCANAPALKVFFAQILKSDVWSQARTKVSRDRSGQGSQDKQTTSVSITSFWSKISFRKKSGHMRSTSGYLSTSTDAHGGVVQMSAHYNAVHDIQRDSMTERMVPVYVDTVLQPTKGMSGCHIGQGPHDIEMGVFPQPSSVRGRETDVPPILPLPEPALWSSSRPSSPYSTTSRTERPSWETRVKQHVRMPWGRREVQEMSPSRPGSKNEI
ncbi:hypothetical protein ACN47E_007278 [Coniothyrium glycines]